MEKKIEQAKKYAQENYVKVMKKLDAYNPDYKREWREVRSKDKDKRIFALTGTPDKAIVYANLKTGEVKAMNQIGEVLKVFK